MPVEFTRLVDMSKASTDRFHHRHGREGMEDCWACKECTLSDSDYVSADYHRLQNIIQRYMSSVTMARLAEMI